MTTEERWRPTPDIPGYEISDHGRVRSLNRVILKRNGVKHTVPARIMKLQTHAETGAPVVSLCYRGKYHTRLIHRLLAEVFADENADV